MNETSGIIVAVPMFEEVAIAPTDTVTGGTIIITAKVTMVDKLFTAESMYSGEINSGEV